MTDKTSVADWSTTADDNDNIGGITLQENRMLPRDVNGAMREMMAQLKVENDATSPKATLALVAADTPGSDPEYYDVAYYDTSYATGSGAKYRKVGSEPSHAGKVQNGNGTWYEIDAPVLTERMFGVPCDGQFGASTAVGTDATTLLQNWLSCPTSKVKKFTGVSRITGQLNQTPGDVVFGDDLTVGITGLQIASAWTGYGLLVADNSANFTRIANLAVNANEGDTAITLTSSVGIPDGAWLNITNPTPGSWGGPTARGYCAGEYVRVMHNAGSGVLWLFEPLFDSYVATSVTVSMLSGPSSTSIHDFTIESPPVHFRDGWHMECIIQPTVRNVAVIGQQQYACGVLERCVLEDITLPSGFGAYSVTKDTQYNVCHGSCHGGSCAGDAYANRHGKQFGSSDNSPGNGPNRNIIVTGNSYSNSGVGSVDIGGHGCSENLLLLGGTHNGVDIGGKNMRYVGATIRKGFSYGDAIPGGSCAGGSEFISGDFIFDTCIFESDVDPNTSSTGVIDIEMLVNDTGPCRFFFNNCIFRISPTTTFVIRFFINGATYPSEIYVNGGEVVGGAGITQFLRIQRVSGVATMTTASVKNLNGLNATALMACVVNAGSGLTINKIAQPDVVLSAAYTIPSLAAGASTTVTLTSAVAGLNSAGFYSCDPEFSASRLGRTMSAYVDNSTQVVVTITNPTASTIAASAAGTMQVTVHRG